MVREQTRGLARQLQQRNIRHFVANAQSPLASAVVLEVKGRLHNTHVVREPCSGGLDGNWPNRAEPKFLANLTLNVFVEPMNRWVIITEGIELVGYLSRRPELTLTLKHLDRASRSGMPTRFSGASTNPNPQRPFGTINILTE